MRTLPLLLLAACGSTPEPEPAAAPEPVAQPAPAEPTITAEVIHHGTLVLTAGERTIWVDPWSEGDLTGHPEADILLITDIHPDHLDKEAIEKVTNDTTFIVAPRAVAEQLERVDQVLENDQSFDRNGLIVKAVPMYNLTRGPEEGVLYHPKGRGNGYLVSMGDTTIYIAGDTACTDEMRELTDVDLAFVPMNLPYTMTPEEAAECVATFRPTKVIPYHYRGSDLAPFAEKMRGAGIDVELVDAYGAENP